VGGYPQGHPGLGFDAEATARLLDDKVGRTPVNGLRTRDRSRSTGRRDFSVVVNPRTLSCGLATNGPFIDAHVYRGRMSPRVVASTTTARRAHATTSHADRRIARFTSTRFDSLRRREVAALRRRGIARVLVATQFCFDSLALVSWLKV
jgi:hypothetical protein